MPKTDEFESALQNLYGIVLKLRIENEVNKVLANGLIASLIRGDNVAIDNMVESIQFTSNLVEVQIKEQWSEKEAIHFRELVHQEVKKFQLLKAA
jgi:hypothetical protein